MAAKRLRAVAEGEAPPTPARKKSVTEAAADGTTRELLVAMRDRVATEVQNPNTLARDLAALTRRLIEITKDIDAIDAAEKQEEGAGERTDDDAWQAV